MMSFHPVHFGQAAPGEEISPVLLAQDVETQMFDSHQTSTVRPMISVVLPVFNEEAILKANVGAIRQYLTEQEHRFEWEILIIDDGSSDESGVIAERLARDDAKIRNLAHPRNFGLGQAFQYAFRQASGDYIVTLDVDLSYDVDTIGRLMDALLATKSKIVLASPFMKGGRIVRVPWLRAMLSRLANAFLSRVAYGDLLTYTSMVRAYDARFIKSMNLRSQGMDIMPETVHKAQILGGVVTEIPATLDWSLQRKVGEERQSSMKILSHILGTALSGFMLRPVLFFFLPGVVLGLLALYSGCWMLIHVFESYQALQASVAGSGTLSGAVANAFMAYPHSFVISLMLTIISVQLVGLGFLSLQSKRYYEELFALGSYYRRWQGEQTQAFQQNESHTL